MVYIRVAIFLYEKSKVLKIQPATQVSGTKKLRARPPHKISAKSVATGAGALRKTILMVRFRN